MARYLVAPAADRALFRRLVARVDHVLGYPRVHADDEPGVRRHGGPPIYTESAFALYMHDDTGAAQLHGAIAAAVDDIAEMRFLEHAGTRKRIRQWIADQGWRVFDDLPGVSDAWTRLAARDGEPGSSTGEPIPEGQE